MMERHELQLDGLRLSYLEQGKAAEDQRARPSLILLHGLMGCAETFLPLMRELAPEQHVVALDLPGAGQSERRAGSDASLEATMLHVQRFVAAVGLQRPVLLGHSYGGALGLRLCATNREALRSLILVAPAHPYFQEANPLVRFYLSLPGRLFAYTMPWFPQWMQMMGLRRMAGPQSWDTPERLKPYRENIRTRGTMKHLLNLLKTWHADFEGLRKLLRQPLVTPTLIVWGDSDRAVPVHSAGELRARLLRSELHVLRGVGHRPAEESPVAVAALIEAWIGSGSGAVMQPFATAYKSNSFATHVRTAPLISSSFEAGD